MITRREVMLSLYGAWRLLLRDRRGLEWLDDSIDGYWKSFFCAVIVLPAHFAIFMLSTFGNVQDAGMFRIVAIVVIGYVISWVAWPLLMAYVAPAIDRDQHYLRYIVAYNWSQAIAAAGYLLIISLQSMAILPVGIMALFNFILWLIVLAYHWFILNVALEVSAVAAVGFVVANFVVLGFIEVVSLGVLL